MKFKITLITAFYSLLFAMGCGEQKQRTPKPICDNALPEGIIIDTDWPIDNDLIITINTKGSITKWVKDARVRCIYLVNDTIVHCQ